MRPYTYGIARNILSCKQPMTGAEIKDWLWFHTFYETDFTKEAIGLGKLFNLDNDKLYKIIRKPIAGVRRRYGDPEVVPVDESMFSEDDLRALKAVYQPSESAMRRRCLREQDTDGLHNYITFDRGGYDVKAESIREKAPA